MVFYPKDQRIRNILDELTIKNGTCTNGDISRRMGTLPEIKKIREKNLMYIGMDRKKMKSVIVVQKLVKKRGRGFIF